MRKVIEDDLGEPLERAFAEFGEEAVAAASIGQVYKARLDDGRFVAVYAGAQAGDKEQGIVIVVTLKDAGGAAFEQALLRTPGRSGPVRVVFVYIPANLAHVVGCPAGGEALEYVVARDAPGEVVLTLRAASGASFTFDAAARRFG